MPLQNLQMFQELIAACVERLGPHQLACGCIRF